MPKVAYYDFSIFRKIYKKLKIGDSVTVLVTGKPNAGKTMFGGLMGEVIHYRLHGINNPAGKWNPKTNCFLDMNLLSYHLLDATDQAILIAEAGNELAYDVWSNKVNKFFDKILQTQRIMRNLYILNIPLAKDLAARHRRKVDFVVECRRGIKKLSNGHYNKYYFARWKQLNIDSSEMTRNEFKPSFIFGSIHKYPLPQCAEALREMDEENKHRIRKELIEEYQESVQKEKETETMKLTHKNYKCGYCGYEWQPKKLNPRRCPECNKRLRVIKGRLENVETSME